MVPAVQSTLFIKKITSSLHVFRLFSKIVVVSINNHGNHIDASTSNKRLREQNGITVKPPNSGHFGDSSAVRC